MVSPVVLGAWTATVIWLVLKYRLLLNHIKKKQPIDWRAAGELLNAIAIGTAVAVAPYLQVLENEAWCPDIQIPPLAAVAVVVGAVGPLFDPNYITPATAVVASIFTTTYLALGDCWGLGSIVAAFGIIVAMIRVAEFK
ncbi:MAG: hypothetical protein CL678_00550 [Bdellovibrionaceae bacterium]|nr:hypothetical protein [Pseudobdellovibrionaceae bacterium]